MLIFENDIVLIAGKYSSLLANHKAHPASLSEFLQRHDNPSLVWIHATNIKQYPLAAEELQKVAEHGSRSLSKKKVSWSQYR